MRALDTWESGFREPRFRLERCFALQRLAGD